MALLSTRNLLGAAAIASTAACTGTVGNVDGPTTSSAPQIISAVDGTDGGGCNVVAYFSQANAGTARIIEANPEQLRPLANSAAQEGSDFDSTCEIFAENIAEAFGAEEAEALEEARETGVRCDSGLRLSADAQGGSQRNYTGVCLVEDSPPQRPSPTRASLGL